MMTDKADIQHDMEQLKADLAQMREDMNTLVQTMMEAGKQKAGSVRDKAQAGIDHKLEQLQEAYDSASRSGEQAARRAVDSIEGHPLTSLAVAFGLGMILGKVMSDK